MFSLNVITKLSKLVSAQRLLSEMNQTNQDINNRNLINSISGLVLSVIILRKPGL